MQHTDKLINAIYNDNLDDFIKVSELFDNFAAFKNTKTKQINNTILHEICLYGADTIFEWFYPYVTKIRKNMFNKQKQIPFYLSVVGPSEKIYRTMLLDSEIDPRKWEDNAQYGGSTRHLGFPILQTINKPEFRDRIEMYFKYDSDYKLDWDTWYVYSMWQNQEWALDLVFPFYDMFKDYTKTGGIVSALTFHRMNMVKKVYAHDNTVFFTTSESSSPLTDAIRYGHLEECLELIPDLSISPKPLDLLIEAVARYKEDQAIEMMTKLQRKNVFVSDELLERMLSSGYGYGPFFDTADMRDDYNERLLPLISNDVELWSKFAPKNIKDVFLF